MTPAQLKRVEVYRRNGLSKRAAFALVLQEIREAKVAAASQIDARLAVCRGGCPLYRLVGIAEHCAADMATCGNCEARARQLFRDRAVGSWPECERQRASTQAIARPH